MRRRGLLGGILAAGFAPAVVGSGVLMPVMELLPTPFVIHPGEDVQAALNAHQCVYLSPGFYETPHPWVMGDQILLGSPRHKSILHDPGATAEIGVGLIYASVEQRRIGLKLHRRYTLR